MESWLNQHNTVIAQITGWQISEKDATDGRLGIMTKILGGNRKAFTIFKPLQVRAISVHINCQRKLIGTKGRGVWKIIPYIFSFNRTIYTLIKEKTEIQDMG